MTDVTNKPASAASTESPINPSSAPATNSVPKTTSKPKNKSKRRPQRRRAAVSDNDSSANEGGNQSDSSASSHSDPADSEDEAEVAETKSVFPDVSSITPAGWKKEDNATESISFEDFEAGKEPPAAPARGTGLAIRGRGKGKVDAGQKREYTPEETARYEAQKAKRKEKQKAKKAELREKAIKDRESKGKEAPAAGSDKPAVEPTSSEKPASKPTPKPAAPTQPSKAKGKKKTESAPAAPNPIAEVTASTSALKLDDPAPEATETSAAAPTQTEPVESPTKSKRGLELLPNKPSTQDATARPQRGPQGNQREAYAQRMAEDPKVTPRVGQFWTHDQRLNDGGNVGEGNSSGLRQMSPFWQGQGRGMPRGGFRGGFRGRGRGFFPNGNGRGGFVNGGPPRPVELSQEEIAPKDKEEGGSKLAMDREFELAEARDKKSRSTPQVVSPPVTADADAEPETTGAAPAVKPQTAPAAERKWGHEAFETMGNPDQFRGFRGRGRGMRARGGFFPRVQHLPFHPATIAAQNAAAAKAAAAGLTPPTTAQPKPESAAAQQPSAPASVVESTPSETVATQPTADSLLDSPDESVKVKFPGSEATVIPAPTPAPAPAATPSTHEAESSAPVTVAKEVSHEAQYPTLHSSSPGPVAAFQAQMYTGGSSNSPFPGSENGSAGSGHFARQQPNGNGQGQFYAPGMNASGEFVPQHQQRPNFRPPMSHPYSPQYQPQPAPYSPGPYGHGHGSPQAGPSYVQGPPMGSPQFFPGPGNGYANGRNSPLNPYMNNGNPVGGYFSPARSASKVAIRPPRPQEGESNGSPHQSNGHINGNGHQQQQGTYYPQHYNPYVQPFVPGQNGQQRQETVYYPTGDQQYGWQGQGYGEQGYYDANGAYGY